jgi:hypothetical protein
MLNLLNFFVITLVNQGTSMFNRRTGWLCLSVIITTFLGTGLPAESQAPLKNSVKTPTQLSTGFPTVIKPTKKWAVINGFRSAKFGMTEKEVLRAITKDFKISKRKVDKKMLLEGKMTALIIHVREMMDIGGPSDIVYILENKKKGLIRINIDWGKSVTDNVVGKDILTTANLLRNNFVKKRYKKKLYAYNKRINDTMMLVFRGLDEKDRSITLRLESPMVKIADQKQVGKHLSLSLSYSIKEQ